MSNRRLLTSTAMPGRNMTTANAWKNLRLALTPRVGTCLSAASNNSVATCELLDKLGRLAKLGNVSPSALVGADGVAENSTCGFWLEFAANGTITLSCVPPLVFLCLYRLDNCRFHPATLMLPRRAQYARSMGRLHFLRPSRSQNIVHSHGFLRPRFHHVQEPISPTTMITVPT
jgi:hypothetical protein